MTVTFIRLETGEDVVEENVIEMLTGSKFYWLEYGGRELTGAYNSKFPTKDYRLISVEA